MLIPLQRAGKLQIESTSFTVSEPTKKYFIEPIIYTFADENQKKLLYDDYDICPFEIETITLERIFIDKVFAIEFYYIRDKFNDVAKHLYDISNLVQKKQIEDLFNNKDLLLKLVSYKREEEQRRPGGIDNNLKIKDFSYFKLEKQEEISKSLSIIQDKYVINQNTVISFESLKTIIKNLYKLFENLE